ncbi:hypothetical protein E4T43_05979 [Aureobasidium subglaciale]|nr:hypothetical protein E4T43_05979 [Aureobasidium subglaciale]
MAGLYRETDAETLALILQLQRDDLEAALGEGATDDDHALQLQLQELSLLETLKNDHILAQSHSRAVFNDRKILAYESLAEQQAVRDHELALQLEQNDNMLVPIMPDQPDPRAQLQEQLLLRLEARTGDTLLKENTNQQLILYTGSTLTEEEEEEEEDFHDAEEATVILCVACTENFPWYDILQTPCEHHYCVECLAELFEHSMVDETLYPPRCCRQPIPLDDAKLLLHPKLIRNFERKSIELDTKDRTYCFDPRCSTFIPAGHITDNIAGCPGCGKRTCAICKVAAHRGDCPRDEALQQFLQAADQLGWQRCYSCHRVVELRTGCNHITCLCGAHFCYVCGAHWNPRSCECPQWDEARLQERAEQIAERDPRYRLYRPPPAALDPDVEAAAAVPADIPPDVPDAPAVVEPEPLADIVRRMPNPLVVVPMIPRVQPPAPVAAEVAAIRPAAPANNERILAQIRDRLERNHECDHVRWRCHRGPHRCEECNHLLPEYIYECRQCHIHACQRCRRNRL